MNKDTSLQKYFKNIRFEKHASNKLEQTMFQIEGRFEQVNIDF